MWQSFFIHLFNQIFPLQCIVCNKPKYKVCPDCKKLIVYSPSYQKCCEHNCWSAFKFDNNTIQKIVHKWKYSGDKDIIKIFFDQIITRTFFFDLIIPVPLHKRRQIERGFNQSEILAGMLSNQLNIPVCTDLKRIRYTKSQATLNKTERQDNIKNVMKWKGENIKNQNIVVVDDVITTGSTFLACADELMASGAKSVQGWFLFRKE